MALSKSAVSELLEAFRTGEGVDLIRESVRMVIQELIEAEATEQVGAGRYGRSESRVTERTEPERALAGVAGHPDRPADPHRVPGVDSLPTTILPAHRDPAGRLHGGPVCCPRRHDHRARPRKLHRLLFRQQEKEGPRRSACRGSRSRHARHGRVQPAHSPAHTRRDRRGSRASPSAAIGPGITEESVKHLRVGIPPCRTSAADPPNGYAEVGDSVRMPARRAVRAPKGNPFLSRCGLSEYMPR